MVKNDWHTSWLRAALLLGGICLTQVVLYGPSLVGGKILLPLDLLAQPRWYLPKADDTPAVVPHNVVLSDPVLQYEPQRRFAATEIRAGRLPLWNPHNHAGVPAANPFSPFNWIYYLWPSPFSLAWIQLFKSLIAGLGAYLFFRRVIGAGFGPAAIGGICYPVTGFFVLWQAYPISSTTAWLPWLLLATDRAIRRPGGPGGPALAACTALVLWSSIDVAGQMLLVSGIYALWCLIDRYGWRPDRRALLRSLAAAVGGWAVGFLLAMPHLLPEGEYVMSGVRAAARAAGAEERPPGGIGALPQTIFPDMYGSWQRGSFRIVRGNILSSSAAAYTGVLATLLLAPLALVSRRHRSRNLLWLALAVLGLAWSLGLPGFVQILRMQGLNLMSHDRLVFASSFAILSLAVTGLDSIRRGRLPRRRWFWIPISLLVALAVWNGAVSTQRPDRIANRLTKLFEGGGPPPSTIEGTAIERTEHPYADRAAVEQVRRSFRASYRRAALLCVLAVGGWFALRLGRRAWLVPLLGGILAGELLWFAYGRAAQCDPELYYPEVEVLTKLSRAPPGRILCVDCLPPQLNRRFLLHDIRGYDAIDPARLVELLDEARDPAATPGYSRTMWMRPRYARREADGVRLPPILDMLGVRYLVRRGSSPAGFEPLISGEDYWVAENRSALPRVFVPRRVQSAPDGAQRLALLAAEDFDPGTIAYVETDLELPELIQGTASIVSEEPTRIEVAVELETAGLVILADRWDPGWRATLDGSATSILRANHALRGVVAPAGRSRLVFDYRPSSLVVGIALMLGGLIALAIWTVLRRRV